ncbi:SRPBCC family protein [Sphingobium sp. CR2-8]|uniref:SRPBCC family protein n=1 Tax=Sphingobium sp. CR2-8 TaxID=1306534 RepID=UPI002DBE0CFA|nr:SRPBCC family protein [Sphingobium sp. CR2-8]MEC3909136.1 SRPBCC family protein [Sphingobium sp. CR2-8]
MTISIDAVIDAPVADIWALISDFGNLARWHPLVERCETIGEGEGAVRTVYFANSWAAERLVRLDHDHHILHYAIVDSDKPSSIGLSGAISLSERGDGQTAINWTSGVDQGRPDAAQIDAYLTQYYPTRIEHLRDALKSSVA